MYTLSAFADEISPDPSEQVDVLARCDVRHIELRSIHKTNVLDLTDLQVQEMKSLLDRHGFRLSAIGSPIGKVKIDTPFEPHLKRFERALELCKVFATPNIRIFSFYPPGENQDWNGVEEKWEREAFNRSRFVSFADFRCGRTENWYSGGHGLRAGRCGDFALHHESTADLDRALDFLAVLRP